MIQISNLSRLFLFVALTGCASNPCRKSADATCQDQSTDPDALEVNSSTASDLLQQTHYAFSCASEPFLHRYSQDDTLQEHPITCDFNMYLVPGARYSAPLVENREHTSIVVSDRSCHSVEGPLHGEDTQRHLMSNNHESIGLSPYEVLVSDASQEFVGMHVSTGFRINESYTDPSTSLGLTLLNYYHEKQPEAQARCRFIEMTPDEIEARVKAEIDVH